MENKDIYSNYFNSQIKNIAPSIDLHLKWSKLHFVKNFSKILPANKDCNILEVGCGIGNNILSLQSMGYNNCYGIDISQSQIDYANRLGLKNVEKVDAIHYLSSKNNQYDCILIIDVLEHLTYNKLIELGKCAYMALKKTGTLIIQVPNGFSVMNPILYSDITHERAFSVVSIKQFFAESGFSSNYSFVEPLLPNNSIISILKNIIWKIFIKPIIYFVFTISYKKIHPAILTPNIIAAVQKK